MVRWSRPRTPAVRVGANARPSTGANADGIHRSTAVIRKSFSQQPKVGDESVYSQNLSHRLPPQKDADPEELLPESFEAI